MYYEIASDTDDEGDMMGVDYEEDHRARSWVSGNAFVPDAVFSVFQQPLPPEPIKILIKEGRENSPMPNFLEEPLTLMSKKLFGVLRQAGVDNIDVYRTVLYYPDGRVASEDLLAFNLIGKVAAADLDKSIYDKEQPDSFIAMTIDKLEVKDALPQSLLMFRMAESVTTILVHEKIKNAVEEAKIELVRFFKADEIAIL